MMDGVLVVRKEKGYTSHDVVAKLRGILHMKKLAIPEHWIRMPRGFFLWFWEKPQNWRSF